MPSKRHLQLACLATAVAISALVAYAGWLLAADRPMWLMLPYSIAAVWLVAGFGLAVEEWQRYSKQAATPVLDYHVTGRAVAPGAVFERRHTRHFYGIGSAA